MSASHANWLAINTEKLRADSGWRSLNLESKALWAELAVRWMEDGGESRPVTTDALAVALGVPLCRAYGLTKQLENNGFARRDADGCVIFVPRGLVGMPGASDEE